MDAGTARTLNMRLLVAQAGGPAEWSRKYGGTRWTQPQVSQWISESAPKGIGGRLARDLEKAQGLAHGELDRPLTAEAVSSQPVGLNLEMLRDAARVAQRVRENSLEPISDDTFVDVLAIAIQRVSARGGVGDVGELAREVAAAFRERSR